MIKLVNSASIKSALNNLVEFVREHNKEDVQIIVPDKLSLFMERYLFKKLNITASFNIKVSTLNRFVRRKNPISATEQITKTGSIILIHKILNDLTDKLKVMNSKTYSFTYAENVFNTIMQLKASKINFNEMLLFDSTNTTLRDKIYDLGLIYEMYESYKAGLLDASDSFLSSAMFIGNELNDSLIYVVGFDDFTAIEYSLLERLAIHSKDLYIMMLYGNSHNKHIYNQEILSQIRSIAYINELGFEIIDKNQYDDSITSYLEQNLFSVNQSNYVLKDNLVKVFSGNNFENELEYVARDIRGKAMMGAKYDKFGVAIFNLEANKKFIEEIFSKYEINYYLDTKFTLDNSIYYKLIASLIKYFIEGYDYIHLIDVINSPFILTNNVLEKKAFIERLLIYKYRGYIEKFDVDENLKNIKDYLVNVFKIIDLNKSTKIEDFIANLEKFNDYLKVNEVIVDLAEKKVNIRDKMLINKSVEYVFKILNEIARFYKEASVKDIYDIFINVAKLTEINNLPLTLDAVKIVDADNVLEIFDDLYLVNASSENAPSLKYDCGIILDGEIAELNFKNKLSPTIAFINRLSKLRLFNTAIMFNDNLTITYSNKPSILVNEILNRFSVEIAGKNEKIVSFNNYVLNNHPLSKWDYIETFCKNFSLFSKYQTKNIKNYEILAEILNNKKNIYSLKEDNKNIFKNLKSVSASMLENYFKCPMYAFLNNTMKIMPRLNIDIQSFDVGNILHEIIYKYYSLNKQVGDIKQFCEREVMGYIDKFERLKLNKNSPIIQNLINECVRVIDGLNYIDNKSNFKPAYFEYEFKDESFSDGVSLVGKIDRIDLAKSGLRIIDYKSGKADASLKELYYGNKLQLFMYSKAVEKILNKNSVGNFYLPLHNKYENDDNENRYKLNGFFVNDINVVHDLDNKLSEGEKSDIVNLTMVKTGLAYKRGKALEIQEYNDLKNYSYCVARKALNEIISGYIMPTPSAVSELCGYCPYKHICMKDSNGIRYRTSKKIAIDSFKE